ncbi:MAG: pentapeptide repeat-containing protein [Nitrospinae bacterium]|nr:pentapeptide repeat-containing protein [Nitrospinota bacterium]
MGDTCKYLFRDNTPCAEPVHPGSGVCFWHDPKADKTGPEIKALIEAKHKRGDKLEGVVLKDAQLEQVKLSRANLYAANFKWANLKNAHLYGADLTHAALFKTALDGANMKEAKLRDAELLGATLEYTKLDFIGFGGEDGYTVKNETEGEAHEKRGETDQAHAKYFEAEEIYRAIKLNLKNRGMGFEAGEYFFKEMVMIRKQIPFYSFNRFWSKLMSVSTGYGEKPHRIIGFSVAYMFLCAAIFSFIGIHHASGNFFRYSSNATAAENLRVFYDALYYSVVTFTTLGYGDFTPVGIGKMIAIVEAYSGAFCISLFSISTYKRYMDR